MSSNIRYVALYHNDIVTGLGRIIEHNGLWGECFVNGEWVRDDLVLESLISPGFAEIVSYGDAESIAAQLGLDLRYSDPKT